MGCDPCANKPPDDRSDFGSNCKAKREAHIHAIGGAYSYSQQGIDAGTDAVPHDRSHLWSKRSSHGRTNVGAFAGPFGRPFGKANATLSVVADNNQSAKLTPNKDRQTGAARGGGQRFPPPVGVDEERPPSRRKHMPRRSAERRPPPENDRDVIVTRITSIGRRRHDAIELKCARFEPIRRIYLWAGGRLPRLLPGGDSKVDGGGSGVAEPAAEGVRDGVSWAVAERGCCRTQGVLHSAQTRLT